MTAWTPPSFRYYRQSDGTITIFDEEGNEVPTPPTMKYIPANGDSKMLDPWGNEVPEFTDVFPKQFFIHTAADGSMVAVDSSGVPLPIQPTLGHGGPEMLAESDYAVLPDGTMYEAPGYEFPGRFFIHTTADGSMVAVDSSGVPLPTQPALGHEVDAPDYAVLSDGTKYVAPAYRFPEEFFIHTAADGSMVAVDSSGVPLPIQPTLGHGGPEMLAESDYAVLPDGTMYEAPPLYPPAGETPEIWPPDPWPPGYDDASEDEDDDPDEVVGADSADVLDPVADSVDVAQQADSDASTPGEATVVLQEEAGEDGSALTPDPARSYSGVRMSEGDVLLDADFSGDETEAGGRAGVASSDLLTVGLVDSMPVGDGVVSATPIPLPDEGPPLGGEAVSATPITLPGEAMPVVNGMDGVSGPDDVVSVIPINVPDGSLPVGDSVVSATPITLPGQELPVGGEDVSNLPVPIPVEGPLLGGEVVSATQITLPGQEMPVTDDASVLPIPVPVPPDVSDMDDAEAETLDTSHKFSDVVALDRKGGDAPVDATVEDALTTDVPEFRVEVIEEVQVQEVRVEDVELGTLEMAEEIAEPEELALHEEGIEELDA